ASAPMATTAGLRMVAWPGDAIHLTVVPPAPPRSGGSRSVQPAGATSAVLVVRDGKEVSTVPLKTLRPVPGPSLWWRLVHG
ncbi:MAG TPA: hypothetical protein VMU09_08460, partial [Acidimicrobiales bacterium]|nr:hypothetical protein [Acidimicrobiales bacterium]